MSLSNGNCVRRAPLDLDRNLDEIPTDELARRAQSGDDEAFTEIATKLRPRLLVVLRSHMKERSSDAEDIVQDALARAWQNISSYDSSRSFISWIYTIALRRATDYLRSHQRRLHHAQQLAPAATTASTTPQALIDQEAVENIWAVAKRALSGPQYSALWLRYAEELPIGEIADTIGKSEVATRVLLHRARTKLQRQFPEESRSHE